MAAQQVQLQRREVGRGDARLGEVAEAGVDAVDGRLALRFGVDPGARGGDARARVRRETDVHVVVGDRQQLGEFEMIAVEKDHSDNNIRHL